MKYAPASKAEFILIMRLIREVLYEEPPAKPRLTVVGRADNPDRIGRERVARRIAHARTVA